MSLVPQPLTPPEAPRKVQAHCTNHCRSCGSHFSSTAAFDRHRQFAEGHDNDWDHRVCVEPADIASLGAKGIGVCKLANPNWTECNATVWTEARNLERDFTGLR